ncbi:uncharacterized protein LOC131317591 [Rhododendron vialii]|uniref:uncharacterized protein LOC131317591 n=1 Tax=Rhododendron vialii TaxID=182163 RepID=UPI00265ECDE9|nr:uncharacterized protein LOC131317591 [Rhododendron vialii]
MAKETSSEVVGEIFQLRWAIWKARNLFVFNSKSPSPEEVIDQAKRANADYLKAIYDGLSSGTFPLPTNVRDVRWEPPPPSYVKFNVDGAFKPSCSLAAFGIIARDCVAIETWALRIACVTAMEQGFSDVIFETDCKNLVRYVSNPESECPWQIETIIGDIRKWAIFTTSRVNLKILASSLEDKVLGFPIIGGH